MLFALPGTAAGAGLIYLVLGHVDPEVWVSLFVLVVLVELALCLLSAHYWNRRAESLVQSLDAITAEFLEEQLRKIKFK